MLRIMHLLLPVLCATLPSISIAAPNPSSRQLLSSSFGVPGNDASFDYVIVGGGTAGLVMATRLAEDLSNSVAVIEAGGFYEIDNGNISVIPGEGTFFAGSAINDTQPLVDWGFTTVPQAGANDRRMHYARGKTLGGSSARNYMVYQRGTIDSYQKWADDVGNPSYTFKNILPYFMKSPQYTPPKSSMYTNSSNEENASAFSNSGGPLQVSFSNYVDPFSTWTQPALEAVGQSEIEGFNSGKLIGSAFVTFTIDPKNAHRSSSESSFLQSSLGNSMLQIYKGTLAQRILFDTNNKAIGVSVSTQSAYGTPTLNYTLSARKEVIVCAGAFQSPQLLMVSGVGPQASLEALNIPLVKHLPGVGQNMWDQVFFGTAFRVGVPTASAPQNDPTLALEAVQAYVQNASGPLSIFGGGYFGWEKLPEPYRSNLSASTQAALATFPADWPELEWIPVSAYLGYSRDYQTEDPKDGYNYATLATSLVAPLSRGNITIDSNSMEDPPIINPNWLTDPADIELAIAAFKRQRQVWTILNNLTIGEEQLPGPAVQSDTDILNFIRESLIQLYHPSATCKMGRANDTMAVIDSSARVYGTQGLRVVDASSFPFLPPGHPQATVYMLAEKIVSEILAGH